MNRFLRAVYLTAACMVVAHALHADSTTVIYRGPTDLVSGRLEQLSAVAFTTETGQPLAGATITFTIGAMTVTGTVSSEGFVETPMTIAAAPGPASVTVAYAGNALHHSASQTVSVTILPQPSAIVITSDRAFPAPGSHTASATLLDAETGAPIAGKILRFAIGASIADAVTDGSGIATVAFQLSSMAPVGAQSMTVTFAGDGSVLPSSSEQQALVFQLTPFVIWGGNRDGILLGDHVVYLAPDWSKQVTAGDYQGAGEFKGVIDNASAITDTCPIVKCWTVKGGGPRAPETQSLIGVMVATSIERKGGQVSGNIVRFAIVAVDPGSTTTRRSGTVVAVQRPLISGD